MLKYIYTNEYTTCFDQYFKYLDSVKNLLPQHLYEFASNIESYELNGDKTLHDAWLYNLEITNDIVNKHKINIKLKLLSAKQDNLIQIFYEDVNTYNLIKPTIKQFTYQNDLLTHELRVSDDNLIEHVIQFDFEMYFYVSCRNFNISYIGQ